MLLNSDAIIQTSKDLLKAIEEDSDSEMAEVDDVMIIVHINYGEVENGEKGSTFYRCSSAKPHIQHGLLVEAKRAVFANTVREDDDEEENV
jgi:hypothetical protein